VSDTFEVCGPYNPDRALVSGQRKGTTHSPEVLELIHREALQAAFEAALERGTADEPDEQRAPICAPGAAYFTSTLVDWECGECGHGRPPGHEPGCTRAGRDPYGAWNAEAERRAEIARRLAKIVAGLEEEDAAK